MPGFGSLGKFFGRTVSEGAAFAAGVAVAPALEPVVQDVKNQAWTEHPSRPLDAGRAAELVAEGKMRTADAEHEAAMSGFDGDRLQLLIDLAFTGPGIAQALTLWRRGEIDTAGMNAALAKAQLLPEFWPAIKALKDQRLDPSQIALGIVRSLLKDPGFLPVDLDTSGGAVPAYRVSTIDPITEAAAGGIDPERLRVMVGEIGLPMSLQSAAAAVFRGIIQEADFNRAVLEGDTRPEWAAAILEQARAIPSVSDYVNARIRGWITDAEMYAGTALHGMSEADTHLLYLRTGRPAAPGQMATAAARGIAGPDGTPMDRAQFLKGIAESDIRPEWGPMLWEARYLYPPLFQLTRLVQAGAITAEQASDWATKDRYPPDVVKALTDYWNQPASATSKAETVSDALALYEAGKVDHAATLATIEGLGYPAGEAQAKIDAYDAKRVTSEKTRVITAAHKAFIDGNLTGPEADNLLSDLGVAEWARTQILITWGLQIQFSV